jgi:hypothetical protein
MGREGGTDAGIAKSANLLGPLDGVNGIELVIVTWMATEFRNTRTQACQRLEKTLHADAFGIRQAFAGLPIKIAAVMDRWGMAS